eukprot:358412-Chlamydomonas_euryale.AAC.6
MPAAAAAAATAAPQQRERVEDRVKATHLRCRQRFFLLLPATNATAVRCSLPPYRILSPYRVPLVQYNMRVTVPQQRHFLSRPLPRFAPRTQPQHRGSPVLHAATRRTSKRPPTAHAQPHGSPAHVAGSGEVEKQQHGTPQLDADAARAATAPDDAGGGQHETPLLDAVVARGDRTGDVAMHVPGHKVWLHAHVVVVIAVRCTCTYCTRGRPWYLWGGGACKHFKKMTQLSSAGREGAMLKTARDGRLGGAKRERYQGNHTSLASAQVPLKQPSLPHRSPIPVCARLYAQRGRGVLPRFACTVGRDALRYDLTELAGLDYLSSPSGVIARAQVRAVRNAHSTQHLGWPRHAGRRQAGGCGSAGRGLAAFMRADAGRQQQAPHPIGMILHNSTCGPRMAQAASSATVSLTRMTEHRAWSSRHGLSHLSMGSVLSRHGQCPVSAWAVSRLGMGTPISAWAVPRPHSFSPTMPSQA